MAEYRLGDLTFDTEEEYIAAQEDLRRIREYMGKYDLKKAADAKALLEELGEDGGFLSDYGTRFMEKLRAVAVKEDNVSSGDGKKGKESGKSSTAKPKNTAGDNKKPGVHIFTVKHIIIGTLIVAAIVAAAVFLLPKFMQGGSEENAVKRGVVLGYVAEQLRIRAEVQEYRETVLGEDEITAKAETDSFMANAYALDLTEQNVEGMGESSIDMVYTKLITDGDIVNGAYQEPPEVTAMKKLIEDARATGQMASEVSEDNTPAAGSPNDEETAAVKVSLINQLMDYQYKTAEALAYEYSCFSLDDGEVEEYVEEDMEKMFGSSIYYMELTEEEKLMYYDSFMERGLFSNRRVKRFSSSPAEYLLPELTPRIMVTLDGTEEELHTIQESIAPVASVAYRLLGRGGEGYLVLRGNADESSILLDSFDEQTYIQGDFLLNLNGIVTMGEWFKDGMEIGLLVDGNRAGRISNVYELIY